MSDDKPDIRVRQTNDIIDWDDRKQIAEVFQANGGQVPGSLSDIYSPLMAVAKWGAQQAIEAAPHDDDCGVFFDTDYGPVFSSERTCDCWKSNPLS